MKTSSFFALAFSALLSFNTASAENIRNTYNLAGTTVSIASKGESLVVYLDDKKSETVSVRIADENGQTLVNEKITNSKKYNVSQLPTGQYNITVTKKDAKTVQPFEVNSGTVTIEEANKKAYFTPGVAIKNENVMVNALVGQYTNITVSILDASGNVVFEDKNYVVVNLHKAYDIANLVEGNYRLVVQAGDEIYTHDFTK